MIEYIEIEIEIEMNRKKKEFFLAIHILIKKSEF